MGCGFWTLAGFATSLMSGYFPLGPVGLFVDAAKDALKHISNEKRSASKAGN